MIGRSKFEVSVGLFTKFDSLKSGDDVYSHQKYARLQVKDQER